MSPASLCAHTSSSANGSSSRLPVLDHADAAWTLGDEHATVRSEGQVPRNAQSLHNSLDHIACRRDGGALGCRALVAAGGEQQKREGEGKSEPETNGRSKEAVMPLRGAGVNGHQSAWPARSYLRPAPDRLVGLVRREVGALRCRYGQAVGPLVLR